MNLDFPDAERDSAIDRMEQGGLCPSQGAKHDALSGPVIATNSEADLVNFSQVVSSLA